MFYNLIICFLEDAIKMKILVAIPCLYGQAHTLEAINSIIAADGILLIDNGAEPAVKEIINSFDKYSNVHIIRNEKNIYVNPAWNQIINFFLNSEFDYLAIMNSDLIMQEDWYAILKTRWLASPDEIIIPTITQDKQFGGYTLSDVFIAQEVSEGTAGVFITLNKKQAEVIYPIPDVCKVWFGDEWIYTILRQLGYKTLIPENLLAYHYWSQNVQKVEGISELIEEDKRQWEKTGRPAMRKIIAYNK